MAKSEAPFDPQHIQNIVRDIFNDVQRPLDQYTVREYRAKNPGDWHDWLASELESGWKRAARELSDREWRDELMDHARTTIMAIAACDERALKE